MERPKSVPLQREAGASTHSILKYEASVIHPVEEMQRSTKASSEKSKAQMLALTFGAAMPMRLQMQRDILGQFHRLPGLPSSHLGHSLLTFRDEMIDDEDYMGRPENSPYMPTQTAHEIMEKRLGILVNRQI